MSLVPHSCIAIEGKRANINKTPSCILVNPYLYFIEGGRSSVTYPNKKHKVIHVDSIDLDTKRLENVFVVNK